MSAPSNKLAPWRILRPLTDPQIGIAPSTLYEKMRRYKIGS